MDHQNDETRMDFLQYLAADLSLYIMNFLDDQADLVRASAVSRVWRQFVITNGLAKQLCLRKFPDLSNIVGMVDSSEGTANSVETNNSIEWTILERNQQLAHPAPTIIQMKVFVNTLNPRDRFIRRASYWSSTGQSNPEVPETLIYKLRDGIWVITEIDIQPFEAFFQSGRPIFSAKFVRFRVGYPKSPTEIGGDLQHLPLQKPADDKFVWTYTSPEFPMVQENRLQPFKLPEPILCIGGYLQIELLGRVQTQEMDGLFYMCVCYVRVLGRPLFPAFDIQIFEPDGKLSLKYYPENLSSVLESSSSDEVPHLRHLEEEMLWERIGLLEELLHGIHRGRNNPFDDDLN